MKASLKYREADNGIQHFVEEQIGGTWKICKVFYSKVAATKFIKGK